MKQRSIIAVTFLTVLLGFQNCSKTEFESEQTEQVSSAPPIEEEDIPLDVGSNVEFPKITTTIPDCQPQTQCRVEFKLSKASTLVLRFNWRTDDDPISKWKTGTLPVNVIWGLANVHYQSGNGTVEFEPGATTKTIQVQNINQTASGIRLKILLNQCVLGQAFYSCQLFF